MTKAEAIKIFGSPVQVANALGISKGAVSQWPDEKIPELRQLQIEKLVSARKIADSTSHPLKQAS